MNVDADRARLPAEGPTLRTASSNSSISSAASGTSLNRRPRTRSRSRTVTGNSTTKPDTTNADCNDKPVLFSASSVAADTSRSEEPNAEEPIRMTKAAQQASQLTAIRTRPHLSAFSRVPLSQIDAVEAVSVNIRDSMITQESEQTNNSTVYPLSTLSSATASPRSPTFSERSMQVEDFKSFDEDDVSYRLRLLVNNNYFLPPAHSKPLPTQLVPATNSNAAKKPPAPTFLDLFRIGRSKSKPPTPTSESGNGPTLTPALRTTSDATAVSGFPMQLQAPATSASSAPPRTSNLGRPTDRLGRVVVVREKMPDLASAAKQAELEMKVRSMQRDQAVSSPSVDDVIDPTDAVDLPLPSSSYPFAVQTSALHGLGVNESIGAAALASRLPPPRDRSPAASSIGPDDDEENWKRALLKAAVGHSFDNLTVAAEGALARSPRSPISPSSSMMSSLPPVSLAASPIPTTSVSVSAAKISKKIISSPIHLDTSLSKSPSIHSTSHLQTNNVFVNPSRPRGWSSPASPTSPTTTPSPIPIRTETPLTLIPLMPPSRSHRSPKSSKREIINPVYSISQTDLTETAQVGPTIASTSQTTNDTNVGHAYVMTPPPGHWRSGGVGIIPRESSESSQSSFRPRESSDRNTSSSMSRSRRTGGSYDDGETPDSLSVYSTMSDNERNSPRPTSPASTSNAQSPTTSAFQDALSRNPSELRIGGGSEANQRLPDSTLSALLSQNLITVPPPAPSLKSSTSQPSESIDSPAPASPPTPTASSLPSTSITPATPVAAPSRTTSLHYRDLRNRHFSAVMLNNPLPSYSYPSHTPSAYPINMPPPPTLAHRSASDQGHSSFFTPPPPAPRKRPPTAPAAPALAPRIELIEISAPEPTTPPFPSFTSLPSFPSLPSLRSPPSPSSANSAPPSPPAQSQPSLIERRHHGGGNPLRGSLHIPTSIIPPAIHSAPPPSESSFPSFPGPSAMMMTSPPSSSMSFFDTIQTQPNAMDYLDESSDEDNEGEQSEDGSSSASDEDGAGSENDAKDVYERDEDFQTVEGETRAGELSVAHTTPLSSLSAYSTPSIRRPSTSRSNHSNRSFRTPLMRLGNHSTPYVSHTSLHAYANNSPFDSHRHSPHQPFGAIGGIGSSDRKDPIGNIPENKPARDFFTKKMRDDEQLLESKWDLWKYTRVGDSRNQIEERARAEMESGAPADANMGIKTETRMEVEAGPSSRAYSHSYSSHPYARAYGPHHSRNYSRDVPSSFAGIPVSGSRTRVTSSSSDQGYGYGSGYGSHNSQSGHTQAQTQAQQKMESKKLDGMLKTHMEAEKDQMKRMAERLKQTQTQGKMKGSAISSKR
ncbi:hypothetical protein J3R30DRAFT_3703392 [Lentinula aciculospora]|uniref:Uncharacterized protein n=1 Tax=Lentinula aciculospora TaxID=153920 RepID=A0A9W9ABI2_9AGAR|nr:hypothetical protein J3R30DRAFT_3703392 [Lentinula aciculospora]